MTRVEEIKGAVQTLSKEEFRVLFEWMAHKDNDLWDRQFERDVESGRLEALGDAALAELHQGTCRPIH